MARNIESHFLTGPEGKLEALLEEPEDGPAREAFVVCHPHPLFGGTMLNKVVHRIAKGLRRSGAVVLRFNFRGVGRSEGEHGDEVGEVGDARAALDWLRERYPDLPYSLAGFSFGSRVIVRLGCETKGAWRLIAVGFPTRRDSLPFLNRCTIPKLFVQSTQDEHGPRAELQTLFDAMAEPKRLEWVEASDHFFAGNLDQLEAVIFASSSAQRA